MTPSERLDAALELLEGLDEADWSGLKSKDARAMIRADVMTGICILTDLYRAI